MSAEIPLKEEQAILPKLLPPIIPINLTIMKEEVQHIKETVERKIQILP